jgi:excisionase family DNA binding protein
VDGSGKSGIAVRDSAVPLSRAAHGEEAAAVTAERFLQLSDVAEILNVSASQTYALVRSGELPAIKIGGRGQWRVERSALEEYIARCYEQTRAFLRAEPLPADEFVD